MPVAEEHEVGFQALGEVDGAVEAFGDVAVALPRHAPVEHGDRLVDRREVLAHLDGIEEQERAALGEDAEPEARAARQLGEQRAQRRLGRREAAHRLAATRRIARIHAGGDVDDRQDVVDVAAQGNARHHKRHEREHQCGGDKPGARIAERNPVHGNPFGTPGRSVHSFSGVCSGFSSSSPTACAGRRTRRMAMSRLYLASQLAGSRRSRMRYSDLASMTSGIALS